MADVLVVDANQSIRKMYVAGLTGFGFSVAEADSHFAAQNLLEAGNIPKVIIADLVLSNAEGRDFLKLLQNTPEYQSIKVIVATVNSLTKEQQRGLGVDAVMVKPIDLSRLVKVVYLYHRPDNIAQ